MNTLFKVFMIVILATIMTGCGSCEKMYDKANYESITNEDGSLVIYSGGKIMAKFSNITITYSAADSDALYFTDVKGSDVWLPNTNGELVKVEGRGENWYNSPGVLLKLED